MEYELYAGVVKWGIVFFWGIVIVIGVFCVKRD